MPDEAERANLCMQGAARHYRALNVRDMVMGTVRGHWDTGLP